MRRDGCVPAVPDGRLTSAVCVCRLCAVFVECRQTDVTAAHQSGRGGAQQGRGGITVTGGRFAGGGAFSTDGLRFSFLTQFVF